MIGPQFADPDVNELLVGDRFGPVIDEEHKSRGQQAEADEAKRNLIMGACSTCQRQVTARITLLRSLIQ